MALSFDKEPLAELSGGDPDFEWEIISTFIGSTEALLHDLATLPKEPENTAIARTLHTLKGSAKSVGAEAFGDVCKDAELAYKAGTYPDLQVLNGSYYEFKQAVTICYGRAA